MTDKCTIPLGNGSRRVDDFVNTGAVSPGPSDHTSKGDVERDVTKTFRLPASLGRRLKVYAARTGQKERTSSSASLQITWRNTTPPGELSHFGLFMGQCALANVAGAWIA